MQTFAPNNGVNVVHALRPDATSVRFRVLDQSGVELQGWGVFPLDLPPPDTISVALSPALNVLQPGQLRAIRVVEFEVHTPGGTFLENEEYALGGSNRIEVGTNSFLTYYEAVLLADSLVGMDQDGWVESDRTQREIALLHAYEKLQRLTIAGELLSKMTAAQIDQIEGLRDALRKAQVAEASDMLDSSPIRKARREGLISMTVGESSQFFGSWRPLQTPVCALAMSLLGRWMSTSVRIYRA